MHYQLRYRQLIAGGIVAGLLAFCAGTLPGSAQAAAPPFHIRVNTTTPTDVLPFFYAQAHGMFKAAGLDVSVTLAPSGSASLEAIVGGATDVGFVNTLTLTNAQAKGINVDAFSPGGEYDTNHPNSRILVLPDSPIHSAKDLAGKTVSVTGLHDLLAVSLQAWIDKHGGDAANVHFVELPPETMLAALQAHRVDAIAVYDPYASSDAQTTRIIGNPFDGIAPHFLTAAWCANASWLASHRDAADKFAQVIHDAAAYTNTHYDQLIPFIAQYSKLKVATLENVAHQQVPPEVRISDVQPVIDAAAKYENLTAFAAQREIFNVDLKTASADR